MSIRAGSYNDDAAPKATWGNAAARWTGKDVMDILMHLLRGDVPATGGVVVGGLECSAGAGITTDVAVGVAIHVDSTVYTETIDGDETASDLGLQNLEAAANVSHSDNTSGNSRIDIVTVKSDLTTDRPKSVQQDGGGTSSQATRWGHDTSVVVTEGTPAGSPSAPSVPTGHTKLCEILVPTGTTSANWAASVTYTDSRRYAAGAVRYQTYWVGQAIPTVHTHGGAATEDTVWGHSLDGHMNITHLNATAETLYFGIPIIAPHPGMKLLEVKVETSTGTVLGAGGLIDVYVVVHDASAPGTPASIGNVTLTNTVAHNADDVGITPTVIEDGDAASCLFTMVMPAIADGASVLFKSIQCQWEEGHR